MIVDHLNHIPAGAVRSFLCSDMREVLSDLESSTLHPSVDFKIVVRHWDILPDQQGMVDDVLRSLAEISLRLWPSWYNQDNVFHASSETALEDKILNLFQIKDLSATQPDLSLPWIKAAVSLCEAGKLPIVNQFSRVLQLSQLAIAIQPQNLVLILAVDDPNPQPYRQLGFARAAAWLATNTRTRVAVLLPADLAHPAELDSILYGAVSVPSLPQSDHRAPEVSTPLESKLTIWPIRGKPHPFSPGEQQLAKKLASDVELGGLFQFNQTVRTVHHQHYLVDLVWAEGQVVVEVDGYRHHGSRFSFRGDRHRDYELLISGYLVLRLPHEDVINDIEIAVEKIRDVVRFRRSQAKSST